MLRIKDRHDREMLYGPTNEELITQLFRDGVKSYRDLPRNLYHIQWKFRDEVRPRFGVMRGREFLMKDGYSFDLDYAGAVVSYRKMMLAYMRTFHPPPGEAEVFYAAAFEYVDYSSGSFNAEDPADLERFFTLMTTQYAAT